MALADGEERRRPLSAPPVDHRTGKEHSKQALWRRWDFRRLLSDSPIRNSARLLVSSKDDSPTDHHLNGNNVDDNSLAQRISRKVNVGLPRTATFARQASERRDRLSPVHPEARRDNPQSITADNGQRVSQLQSMVEEASGDVGADSVLPPDNHMIPPDPPEEEIKEEGYSKESECDGAKVEDNGEDEEDDEEEDKEMDKRWILNLSMHFRDRSEREKFFVTYAETPNRWRRVTVSCDYRDAEAESLEEDLRELRYQRDKSARIYDCIRDSLPEIQFYDSVTNLRLETRDGRLHVHVTEDVNEIVPYPAISCASHLSGAPLVPESLLEFDAHLSGFVYKVRLEERELVKKEIPGPDAVDEFFYEINALHMLRRASNVVRFEGIVVDDIRGVVKGLLLSYASRGALVDILYEQRGGIPWERRERWARQIVSGMCEIHEAGYVQGDSTPSNIVVDEHDNAKIIDINRRGCPVGFEPPEIAAKIASNQRISMYIGVKTDIFQLGMTLWALAMQEDEPERQEHPLIIDQEAKVPEYFRKLVAVCLSPMPQHRLSAKELLALFPRDTLLHSAGASEVTMVGNDRHDKLDSSSTSPVPVNAPESLDYSTSPRDSLDDGYGLNSDRYSGHGHALAFNPLGGNPVRNEEPVQDIAMPASCAAFGPPHEPDPAVSLALRSSCASSTSAIQEPSISALNLLSKSSLPINPAMS